MQAINLTRAEFHGEWNYTIAPNQQHHRSGYLSAGPYLRGFPFDALKIDRSFLRALSSDPQARALVEAMLAMATALGLDVVGEGVETPQQLSLLGHLKCRWVQGYLLGRPVPREETRDRTWRLAASHARGEQSVRPPMPVASA
jgi:predicted signal transduction protein with EAL and GGDEF domain